MRKIRLTLGKAWLAGWVVEVSVLARNVKKRILIKMNATALLNSAFFDRYNSFDKAMGEVRRVAFCCAGLRQQRPYRICYCPFCVH